MSVKRKLEDFTPDTRLVDERGPTAERMLKTDGLEVGDTGTITIRQSPIERGYKRDLFNEKQFMAATKLYGHWYKSGLGQELGAVDWNRVRADDILYGGMARTETQAFHRQRFRSAMDAVRGKMAAAGHNGSDAARVLLRVVCAEMPLGEAGLAIGYRSPKKAETAAIILTKCGLNILASEWGI